MKNIILGIFSTALLAQTAGAYELSTRVVDVQLTQSGDEIMIFEEGGRVLWAPATERQLQRALKQVKADGLSLKLDIDPVTNHLKGVQLINHSENENLSGETVFSEASFTPTELSMDEARSIFSVLDGNTKRKSQCFNRAHGWAYDMWTQKRVNSMKMFIFFTRKYIEEFKYNWWFHVAPYVHVKTPAGVEERLMDRTFSEGPDKVKDWTDMFVRPKPHCPVVDKYTDFYNNQWSSYCYLIKANMYYRSPKDLERLEKEGRQELNWNQAEIREARKQAFKNWRDYYPRR